MAPRTILYTGKGGVGKTSVAAATARSCAAAGLRTVVLSTDPAHSLSDSLEAPLGAEPTQVGANLFGQEVQAQEEMERHWEGVQGWLGDLLAERGIDRISAEELTVPPGMDELFSLLWIKRHHEEGEFDCVIVDCAPTGETLRLLSFPDVVTWWLERILPSQRKLAPFARTLFDMPLPGEAVFDGRGAPGAQPRGDERHPARPLAHDDPAGDEPGPDGGQGVDADLHLPEPLRLPDRRRGGEPAAAARGLLRRLARGAGGAARAWCARPSRRCPCSPPTTSSAR